MRLRPLAIAGDGATGRQRWTCSWTASRAAAPDHALDAASLERAAAVCRAVGGLPLAVELAAAASNRYPLDVLADRLSTRLDLIDTAGPADRHSGVERVLESSDRLLAPDEQTLLDRLSMFAGSFDVDDVDALDAAAPTAGLGAVLGALVDESMVPFHPDSRRYELLPPVRAIARRHLGECAAASAGPPATRRSSCPGSPAPTASCARRRGARRSRRRRHDRRPARCADRLRADDDVVRRTEMTASLHCFAMMRDRSELSGWAAELVPLRRAPGAGRVPRQRRHRRREARGSRHGTEDRLDGRSPGRRATLLHEDPRPRSLVRRSARRRRCVRTPGIRAARRRRRRGVVDQRATVEVVALAYAGDAWRPSAAPAPLVARADQLGTPSVQAMTRYVLAESIDDPAEAARAYCGSITLADEIVSGVADTSLAAQELRCGRTQEPAAVSPVASSTAAVRCPHTAVAGDHAAHRGARRDGRTLRRGDARCGLFREPPCRTGVRRRCAAAGRRAGAGEGAPRDGGVRGGSSASRPPR